MILNLWCSIYSKILLCIYIVMITRNSDLWSWSTDHTSQGVMTISRFNFPPQRSRCWKYLFGILRNNYITGKFLTRCIIIRKHIKPKSFRHAFSAGSFFLCLPVRALRKQQHNLARKGVSGPSIIRLWNSLALGLKVECRSFSFFLT